MRKVVLIIGLVIVLVGSIFGGLALHAGAATPTLQITVFSGVTPCTMTVAGKNWNPGTEVSLYVDAADLDHRLAVETPAANGVFVKSFPLGSLDLGNHVMIAFQDPNGVAVQFVVTARQLIDQMTGHILSDMVYNSEYGLKEIKSEVKSIESEVKNSTYGLAEIKTEVSKAPAFDVDSGLTSVENGGKAGPVFEYDSIRHVNLTLFVGGVSGISPNDNVEIKIHFGTSANLLHLADNLTNGIHTFQFDTDKWDIYLEDLDTDPLDAGVRIDYEVTTLAKMP